MSAAVRVPRPGRTEALPVTDGIHFGSRWSLSGKGDTGNTFEVVTKERDDHPCDYRLRLVALGPRADRRSCIGDEFTVSPEWFTERARRAS